MSLAALHLSQVAHLGSDSCGLSSDDKSAKWTPPKIDIASLKYLDLAEAVKLDTFSACTKWVDLFNSVGASSGLPPIFLASIALTESSCNSDAVAPGGGKSSLTFTRTNFFGLTLPPPPIGIVGTDASEC